jgi:Toprim domain
MSGEVHQLSHIELVHLAGNHIGVQDVPCPRCGPGRRSPSNKRRKVLRIWRVSRSFATYRCARCDIHGYAREDGASAPDPQQLAKAGVGAQHFAVATAEARRTKAQWLWAMRRPISRTPAARYLRESRRYNGPLPGTLGFLPGRGEYPPAMIAAFGMPTEVEPDVISILPTAVQAVHITRLLPDGSAKAGTHADKIMVGTPLGTPIVLASPNDLNGITITEGIEDALSMHEATGLGAWAAGSACFLPALAAVIPSYIDFVTIVSDPDQNGQHFARELKARLAERGVEHSMIVWGVRARNAE